MIRRRIPCASEMVLSWKQFSSPGTPCVFEVEPTAMTNLSYLPTPIHTSNQILHFRMWGWRLTGDKSGASPPRRW